jgi:RNA polymerase sigma factor (sigma-70 family)
VLDDAGRALVEEYSTLAASIAWAYWRRAPRADVEELRAIALAALVQAADRFPDYQREHGYPLDDHRYLVAFLTRRMRGAILDHARAQDHVSRTQRRMLKALEDVAVPGAGPAELAEAAGLPEDEVRAALAAQAAKPVYLDDLPDSTDWPGGLNVPDPAADVEGVASVRAMLGAAARAFAGLPPVQQVVLVRVFMHGQDLGDVAGALGISRDRAGQLHEAAVITLHEGMLAVASEGCACGRNGSCACGARREPGTAE